MNCPACDNPMITLMCCDVETDYCTNCGGVWLDSGEIELIMGTSAEAADFLAGFKTDLKATEKYKKCPRCRAKMLKVIADTNEPVLLLDECPKRHGLWFDSGELAEVVKRAKLGNENVMIHTLEETFKAKIKKQENI